MNGILVLYVSEICRCRFIARRAPEV